MSRGGDTRYPKGQSGNLRGRPRKAPPGAVSAFDVIIDQRITVTQNGVARELTVDEALQHETLTAAFKGKRQPTRTVLGWIETRDKARRALRPQFPENSYRARV